MEFILKYKKQFIIGGILSLFLIGTCLGYYFIKKDDNHKKTEIVKTDVTVTEKTKSNNEEVKDDAVVKTEHYVDIKGSVANPGVYKLTSDSIVNDVITLAGGVTEEGDTTCINLSKKIKDEMVIYVYNKEETKDLRKKDEEIKTNKNVVCNNLVNEVYINPTENPTLNNNTNNTTNDNITSNNQESNIKTETSSTTDKINLNTADVNLLSTLPNIGESKAKAIIEYRNINGNFTTIEEIKEVSGIGESTFLKIKDLIIV